MMKDYVQANKNVYERLASEYRDRIGRNAESLDVLVGKPLQHAKNRFDNILALELGPGSGEVCRYLEENGCETTAVDVAQNMLDNVRAVSPETTLVHGDVLEVDLGVAAYELVYCGAFIHFFQKDDARSLMNDVYDAIRPGGVLFVNTTVHESSRGGFEEKEGYNTDVERYRHRYTREEFKKLVKGAGFSIVDTVETEEADQEKSWLAFIAEKQ